MTRKLRFSALRLALISSTVSMSRVHFGKTRKAAALYNQTKTTDAMSKAAALGNISAEEIATATFPALSAVGAMNAWLYTLYSENNAARAAAPAM
jgi:hypothetical protein